MRPVRRGEIVDHATYSDIRETFREEVLEVKKPRRIHLGEQLTLLFENTLTVRYQIQEMMRVEQIVREADIRREIDTYNEILGGPGELGCTLLIEIEDDQERSERLQEWFRLPEHLYLRMKDERRVRPRFDERQRGGDRLSAVQYLRFEVGEQAPVAAGVDLAGLEIEAELTAEQRNALQADLRPA